MAHDGHKARLNGSSYWEVKGIHQRPWVQVDIGYSTAVSGLLTQGGGKNWVTKLKVSTSAAGDDPKMFIRDEDGDEVRRRKNERTNERN